MSDFYMKIIITYEIIIKKILIYKRTNIKKQNKLMYAFVRKEFN